MLPLRHNRQYANAAAGREGAAAESSNRYGSSKRKWREVGIGKLQSRDGTQKFSPAPPEVFGRRRRSSLHPLATATTD